MIGEEFEPGADDGDEGPIGPFPNWKAVYWSVVIYTLALIGILWAFTVVFDHSVS